MLVASTEVIYANSLSFYSHEFFPLRINVGATGVNYMTWRNVTRIIRERSERNRRTVRFRTQQMATRKVSFWTAVDLHLGGATLWPTAYLSKANRQEGSLASALLLLFFASTLLLFWLLLFFAPPFGVLLLCLRLRRTQQMNGTEPDTQQSSRPGSLWKAAASPRSLS